MVCFFFFLAILKPMPIYKKNKTKNICNWRKTAVSQSDGQNNPNLTSLINKNYLFFFQCTPNQNNLQSKKLKINKTPQLSFETITATYILFLYIVYFKTKFFGTTSTNKFQASFFFQFFHQKQILGAKFIILQLHFRHTCYFFLINKITKPK